MAHIREVRPQAREVKFVVDAHKAGMIRQWARTHLDPDPHGGGQFGDEYRTTSVYFDTDAFDVFYRRGSFGRSKYRIRRYGEDETVFLERKMRQPAVLAKRRTILSLAALPRLTESVVGADWPGYWFHRRVTARRLRPVCQVAYLRMARGVMRDGEQVRLTLDSDLQVVPTRAARFSPRGRRAADAGYARPSDSRTEVPRRSAGHLQATRRRVRARAKGDVEVSPRRGREWAGRTEAAPARLPEPTALYA